MPSAPLRIDPTEVKIDRTFLLDATFDALRSGRNLLPEDLPHGYVDEMTSPRRMMREVSGRRQAHYKKRGDDDYAHAEAFDYLASRILSLPKDQPAYETVYVPFEEAIPGFRRTHLGPGFPTRSHSDADLEFSDPPRADPPPHPPEVDLQNDDLEFGTPPWLNSS